MSKKTKVEKEEVKVNKKKNLIIKLLIFGIIVVICCISFAFQAPLEKWLNFKVNGKVASTEISEGSLKVHFIDVNQADCIAIETPDNKVILIDSGDNNKESQQKMTKYLSQSVITADEPKVINHFIITHAHADHVGGASLILENYEVQNVYLPDLETIEAVSGKQYDTTNLYEDFIDNVNIEAGCNTVYNYNNFVNDNYDLVVDGVSFEFYGPYYNEITCKNPNNQSPIIVMTFAGKKFMFTGDAEKELEKDVLTNIGEENYDELNIDVLKVAHHGGKESSCAEFLEVASPEFAVISCGEGNKYKHPTKETLTRLSNAGVKPNSLYRTDNNGSVMFAVSNDGKISVLSQYIPTISFYVELEYIVVVIIGISALVILVPKKNRKKIVKLISNKK